MKPLLLIIALTFPIGLVRGLDSILSTIPIVGNLQKILEDEGTANIFITLSDGPEQIFDGFLDRVFSNRADQIKTLTNGLKDHANRTQATIVNFLNQFSETSGQNLTIKQFWITNQIYVQGANPLLVRLLQAFTSIIGFIREEVFAGFGPMNPQTPETDGSESTWGLEKIDVAGARALKNGLNNPVVIGSIDSGVRYTHEEVKDSFVGVNYGWFDPYEGIQEPYDNNGHGTHTMATIVGKNVGVAPDVKWMTCKGCRDSRCAQSDLLSCGQFLLCPTKPDGTDPDCSKAPEVINNSWGNDGGADSTYVKMIDAWRSAGIIPIFSSGNSGPRCSTVSSPGDYKTVISVGSSNIKNEVSSFSSKGPVGGFFGIGGSIKPDLAAPGEDVISAWNTGDSDYRSISGTSMAAPHVTGVVALMMQAKANMTFEEVKAALLDGTTQNGVRPLITCELQFYGLRYPNNEFGQGILNAKNSLEETIS